MHGNLAFSAAVRGVCGGVRDPGREALPSPFAPPLASPFAPFFEAGVALASASVLPLFFTFFFFFFVFFSPKPSSSWTWSAPAGAPPTLAFASLVLKLGFPASAFEKFCRLSFACSWERTSSTLERSHCVVFLREMAFAFRDFLVQSSSRECLESSSCK